MPVVGFLNTSSPEGSADLLSAFRRGLNDTGYIEGESLGVEYRWSENQIDRLPALAADLVRRQCAAIVAGGKWQLAAKAATTTIPIVSRRRGSRSISDLYQASTDRKATSPAFSSTRADLQSKQLELLREVVPNTGVIGVLVNPKSPRAVFLATNAQEAARALGLLDFHFERYERESFRQSLCDTCSTAGRRTPHHRRCAFHWAGGAPRRFDRPT